MGGYAVSLILRTVLAYFMLFQGIPSPGPGNINPHSGGGGGVINAASCSQGDVKAALNLVVASTSQVNIPAGTCTWTANISWTVPSGSTNLKIAGATTCTSAYPSSGTCTDRTIIIDNDTTDSNWLWEITTAAASSVFTFTGLTFETGTGLEKQEWRPELAGV